MAILKLRLPALLIAVLVVMLGLWPSLLLAGDSSHPPCLMQPDVFEMRLPGRGFAWLPGEDSGGGCEEVPKEKWIRVVSGSVALFVYPDGPSGSGRYWRVTVGVGGREHSTPDRGVCLMTSTVGWRTLQQYKRMPLPWLEDLDDDRRHELIIWSSFPLHEDSSLAEYGLVAWVYRPASEDVLTIDWALSRRMAREIAQAYRDSTAACPARLRTAAAEALEQFAGGRCLLNGAPR